MLDVVTLRLLHFYLLLPRGYWQVHTPMPVLLHAMAQGAYCTCSALMINPVDPCCTRMLYT